MVPGGSSGGPAAATPQHILFGSDYPYVKTDSSLDELCRARLSSKEIECQNVERLLTRLKA